MDDDSRNPRSPQGLKIRQNLPPVRGKGRDAIRIPEGDPDAQGLLPDKDVLQTDRFIRFSTIIILEASKDSSDKEEKKHKLMHRMETAIAEACQDAEKKNNFPVWMLKAASSLLVNGERPGSLWRYVKPNPGPM